jgi:hypothetical protein
MLIPHQASAQTHSALDGLFVRCASFDPVSTCIAPLQLMSRIESSGIQAPRAAGGRRFNCATAAARFPSIQKQCLRRAPIHPCLTPESPSAPRARAPVRPPPRARRAARARARRTSDEGRENAAASSGGLRQLRSLHNRQKRGWLQPAVCRALALQVAGHRTWGAQSPAATGDTSAHTQRQTRA